MSLVDLFSVLIPAAFLLLLLLESLRPARAIQSSIGWQFVGVLGFVVMAAIGTLVPLAVPASVFERIRLVDLSSWGLGGGFAVGWAVYTLIGYAWHRAVHGSPLLWRVFHQLHHAPARLDVASSTIFHPAELVFYTLATLAVTLGLGLTPEAGALLGFFGACVSFFQHANLRTPLWLGYLVQRPEAHSLHHRAGGPVGNYSDLPLWDLLFGTFHNPRHFETELGLPRAARRRWAAMLAFVDVGKTPEGEVASAIASARPPAPAPQSPKQFA